MVYTRKYQIGLTVEDGMHGNLHTVDRSACDAEHPYTILRRMCYKFERAIDSQSR